MRKQVVTQEAQLLQEVIDYLGLYPYNEMSQLMKQAKGNRYE